MPYTYYTKMTREDVIAIRAHLDTVEPVRNLVQANQLPFPFNQREAMVGCVARRPMRSIASSTRWCRTRRMAACCAALVSNYTRRSPQHSRPIPPS
jgi:hypothetical protein